MYNHRTIFFIFFAACIFCVGKLAAQDSVKTHKNPPRIFKKKSLVLSIGGGVSKYVSSVSLQPNGSATQVSTISPSATIRLYWQPQFRLRVGLESGYCRFYSYKVQNGNTKGDVSLTAIPLMIVWSMPIVKRLDIFAGFGSYLLTSRLNYSGQVISKIQSLGSSFALAYRIPVSPVSSFAAEAKWMNAFQTKDNALSLEVRYIWKFFQWGGIQD